MNAQQLMATLRRQCGDVFTVTGEDGRLDVHVPFFRPDGDGIVVVAEHGPEGWRITDEGDTAAYLEIHDVEWNDQRRWLAEDAASAHGVKFDDGELVMPLTKAPDWYNLADFIQAVTHLTSVEFAGQRRPAGEQFPTVTTNRLRRMVADERLVEPRWAHPQRDPERVYYADQALFRHPDQSELAMVTFAVGTSAAVNHAAVRANWWAKQPQELPRLIVVREEAGLKARDWSIIRDTSTETFTLEEANDGALLDALDRHGVATAA